MKNARYIALVSLLNVEKNGSYSNIALNSAIKKASLDKRDATFCSAIFYGVLEKKLFLDYVISKYSKMPLKEISDSIRHILYIGLYQILLMDKVPQTAAVNESVNLCRKIKEASAAGFVNGLLRAFLRNNCETYIKGLKNSTTEYLSVKYSVAEWIVDLFLKSYPNLEIEPLLNCLSGRPPINVKINTLKGTREAIVAALLKEGLIVKSDGALPNCLEISNTSAIDQLVSYKNGLFHVEDKASQLCCKALSPAPGHVVVDVCAAPGGKSFTIAELMKNKGQIFSHDLYEAKINLIKSGAARLGIDIINASVRDARQLPDKVNFADRVLCDVPCSGLGVVRRKPEIRYKEQSQIEELPALQFEILCASEKMLKPGGILVYSTCTLNPKENNEIADKFLKEHPNYEPVPIELEGIKRVHNEPDNQLTLFPSVHGTDGFFIAKFRKLR